MRRSRSPRGSAPEQAAVSHRYKVVETSSVSDEELETILNEWTAKGWTLDSIQFAMRESSKRPSMAFVLFSREDGGEA
jgi:hypothetical protein